MISLIANNRKLLITTQTKQSKRLIQIYALSDPYGSRYLTRELHETNHDEDAQVYPCAPPFLYHSKWGDSPTHVVSVLQEIVSTLFNNSLEFLVCLIFREFDIFLCFCLQSVITLYCYYKITVNSITIIGTSSYYCS